MEQTASDSSRATVKASPEAMSALIDLAGRLRQVRRAQRKFIRRWADQKLTELSLEPPKHNRMRKLFEE